MLEQITDKGTHAVLSMAHMFPMVIDYNSKILTLRQSIMHYYLLTHKD
jgi:hypothetical protein